MANMMEGTVPVKRWDGLGKACRRWNNLARDPDLWFSNGNCLVYLYRKGQSRREASFKVPLSALLVAKCHPLVEKCLALSFSHGSTPVTISGSLDTWSKAHPTARVALFIPPPQNANKIGRARHYLAVRNFFAWIFNTAVVGETLGASLVALLALMREFRCVNEDNNVDDLLHYTQAQGYLDMKNQPIHALAMLHLAQESHLRDLYVHAFAHCAGMYDELYASPEYQILPSVTRSTLRRAKKEADQTLGRAGRALRNLLEDELSEANLGLGGAGRAHLERFRCFLLSFYSNRLGYYPPASTDATRLIFEPEVYRLMHDDFAALYAHLVDRTFTMARHSPDLARGGLCVTQSVQSFDVRYGLSSLPHPLPLLPETPAPSKARPMSWVVGRADKRHRDRDTASYATLAAATNRLTAGCQENALVAAYRRFEKALFCSPIKVDRQEKLSPLDGRKIRWVLVYAAYQVLRTCVDTPAECTDIEGAHYSMLASASHRPPWEADEHEHGLHAASSAAQTSTDSSAGTPMLATPEYIAPVAWGIQPDIDYFTLNKQADVAAPDRSSTVANDRSWRGRSIAARTNSLQGSIRRSLSRLRPSHGATAAQDRSSFVAVSQRTSYHDIVVQGYSDGTNPVEAEGVASALSGLLFDDIEAPQQGVSLAMRSPSTSSHSSHSSADSDNSEATSETVDSSVSGDSDTSSPKTSSKSLPSGRFSIPPRQPSFQTELDSDTTVFIHNNEDDSLEEDITTPEMAPPLPRRNSKRNTIALIPSPLRVRKEAYPEATDRADAQSIYTDRGEHEHADEYGSEAGDPTVNAQYVQDVQDLWDQFVDVGGLTEATRAVPIC